MCSCMRVAPSASTGTGPRAVSTVGVAIMVLLSSPAGKGLDDRNEVLEVGLVVEDEVAESGLGAPLLETLDHLCRLSQQRLRGLVLLREVDLAPRGLRPAAADLL